MGTTPLPGSSAPPAREETSGKQSSRNWLEKLGVLFAVLGGIFAALAALIGYLNPFRGSDLSVWIMKEIPINLNVPSEAAPLALTFNGEPIQRATFLEVRIANYGTVPVGGTEPWQITFQSRGTARVILLPKYVLNPSNLEFRLLPAPHSGSAGLQIGLLRAGDYADVQMIILDPVNAVHPEVFSEASRRSDVPRPTVSRQSLEDRIEARVHSRFVRWLEYALAAAFVAAVTWIGFREIKPLGRRALLDFWFKGLMVACFAAAVVGAVIKWLLKTLILMKLDNSL